VDQDIAIKTGNETVRLERTAAAKVWVTAA
jgi:hypothetical protein